MTTRNRRTQSCNKCGAPEVRVTYESASGGFETAPGVLIAASCTNEDCEWFDQRTKRRQYANEAVALVAESAS